MGWFKKKIELPLFLFVAADNPPRLPLNFAGRQVKNGAPAALPDHRKVCSMPDVPFLST